MLKREPQREDETDADFEAREVAFWEAVDTENQKLDAVRAHIQSWGEKPLPVRDIITRGRRI